MNTQEQVNQYWSKLGLNPELFPVYYPMGPSPFLDGGSNPSGAASARATLSRDLSNFPHMFLGLRITNVYALPEDPTADEISLFSVLKNHVDGEQGITIQLSQQDVVVQSIQQKQLVGGQDATYWHPFPIPFPMAGGNNILVTVTRTTPYPLLRDVQIVPTVYATIYAAVARADLKTIAPQRIFPG